MLASLGAAFPAGLAAAQESRARSRPAATGATQDEASDPRTHYDVRAYRLDLVVDPEIEELRGAVGIEVEMLRASSELVLDLERACEVLEVARGTRPLDDEVALAGEALAFEHTGDLLRCRLPMRAAAGERVLAVVRYRASPGLRFKGQFGFFWKRTPDGRPWIATSCQPIGAHSWWPCKSSYDHPGDKPERVLIDLTVPAGLVAVSNGRLVERARALPPLAGQDAGARARRGGEWERFRWRHDYPIETYSVALAVGPFAERTREIALPETGATIPLRSWVLPGHEERAELQFAELPEILATFVRAFGPYPFPGTKIGLVEVPFLGMGHATLLSYGSSFPAWRAREGLPDPLGNLNRDYDYVLVHELAHEWWGNSVSVASWAHMWMLEGFATYAEGLWIEERQGRAAADAFYYALADKARRDACLVAGGARTPREGYSTCLYYRGGAVLHALRHEIDDDDLWWSSLRRFQERFRHASADTDDFQAVVEEVSGRDLDTFFDEWVRGRGFPCLVGELRAEDDRILIEAQSRGADGRGFHVPIDLRFRAGGEPRALRVQLAPGENRLELVQDGPVEELELLHLGRIPGRHRLTVQR